MLECGRQPRHRNWIESKIKREQELGFGSCEDSGFVPVVRFHPTVVDSACLTMVSALAPKLCKPDVLFKTTRSGVSR